MLSLFSCFFEATSPPCAPVLSAKIFTPENVNSTIQELCCSYERCGSFYISNSTQDRRYPHGVLHFLRALCIPVPASWSTG